MKASRKRILQEVNLMGGEPLLSPWRLTAYRKGERAAMRGIAMADWEGEAERQARAYMLRAIKERAITPAEGARQAIEYRRTFLQAATLTAHSRARQTGDVSAVRAIQSYFFSTSYMFPA